MQRPLAILAGAGRRNGIGAAIAQRLVDEGWDLVLPYWSAHDVEFSGADVDEVPQMVDDFREKGAECIALDVDFRDPASLQSVLDTARGRARALILAQARDVATALLDTAPEELEAHFAVNVVASLRLIQGFAPTITGDGRIIAFTSDATVRNVPYGVSKGALDRLVLAAARELGPLGISANLIDPGPVDTGWMTPELAEYLAGSQPLGRLGTPVDIAGVVSFLLSPAGRWVSGQLLHVDGGFTAPGR